MKQKPRRNVLGKGIGALIPLEERTQAASGSAHLTECSLDSLVPNQQQPRQSFSEQKLEELTESIRASGVIHPLIVRAHEGGYQIIAGERRWRAARLAGLKSVPVIIKDVTEADMLVLALIENLQREDLNPLEEADAYRQLIEEHGLTQEQLAGCVGKQRSSVANSLRLLKLPEEVRRLLLTGEITMGHARAILGVEGTRAQVQLATLAVRERLSVRQCEELVRRAPRPSGKPKGKPRRQRYTPEVYRLIESLQRRLGTKVDILQSKKAGRVVIHYYGPGELDRIVAVIEGS